MWTLLVILTVLGVWLGFHVKLSRDQQRGVAAIKKLGGTAHYTYQLTESGYDATTEPPLPAWIWKWVGKDFFWRVMVADLHGKQIQHDDLTCLKNLSKLAGLNLGNTDLTDEAIAHVAQLSKLDVLVLVNTYVTDKSLARIENLSRLRILDLAGTGITDAGLVHLAALNDLQYLRLDDTAISDEGISHLVNLKALTVLDLRNTNVSSKAVKTLRQAMPTCNVVY